MSAAEWGRLGAGATAIAVLVVLISKVRLHPFLALLLVSLALGAATALPLDTLVHSFEAGMGATLGHTATVIALGSMLGKMLAESGGAEVIAQTLLRRSSDRWLPWTMLLIGLIVGLPVFFEVGFVLLMPVAFTVARQSGQPLLRVALPMLAGLSVVHAFVLPHPAAILAVAAYHADLARTLAFALLVGVPVAALAGPIYGGWISKRVHAQAGTVAASLSSSHREDRKLPGFGVTLATILLPAVLMLGGGWSDSWTTPGSMPRALLHLAGNGDVALLCGVLFSLWSLGASQGMGRERMGKLCGEALLPTAAAVLLIGGGGGFGRVLQDGHVAEAAMHLASLAHLPLLLTAWLFAALMRLAVGSSTVAMTTAAAIVAPVALHTPGARPELLALATGAGSIVFSHVNDGGFWLVTEYLNLEVAQTFATWSVLESILSVGALVLLLVASAV
jgi:gluconate:H+ symporter, GntP family